MRTRLIIAFVAIFISNTIYSQNNENESEQESVNDAYSSIMINASYTSNNLEYLTGSSEKIPTLFSNLSFFHKTGIYAGVGYSKYFSDSISSYEYDVELGYQKYFDNGFDIDFSYNWHNFNGDSLLEGLNYDHSLMLMLGQDIGSFYLSSSLNYTLGNTNNLFFDLNLSRFFELDGIFAKNDALLFNPTLSLSFSTDYWLYEDLSDEDKTSTFATLKNAGYSYESFSYESFDIYLPISYGIANTYFTFSYLYKIPSEKYKTLGWENKSGFMLSLTYFLNFTK